MGYNVAVAIRVLNLEDKIPIEDMTGRRPVDLKRIGDEVDRLWDEQMGWTPGVYMHTKSLRKEKVPVPFLYLSEMKWHGEYDDILVELSRHFPAQTFIILGIGEDALFGDVWIKVIRGGRAGDKQYVLGSVLTDIMGEA
jgi:hypothetical protein